MKKLAVVVLTGVIALFARAEDLTIEAGSLTSFSADSTYGRLRVEGEATVDNVKVVATNLVIAGGSVTVTGSGAQFGTTSLKESAKDCVFTNAASGACGAISVSSSARAWLGYLKLYADPEVVQDADGYLDFLSLSGAGLTTRRVYNYSSLTGRIDIVGKSSISHPADGYDYNGLFQLGAFELVLHDNASLSWSFGNQKAMIAAEAASLVISGTGDVTVTSGSGTSLGYAFNIFPKTVFRQQGALTLNNVSYESTWYRFAKDYAFGSNLTQLNLTGYDASHYSCIRADGVATVTLPPKTACKNASFLGTGTIRLDATSRAVSLSGSDKNGEQLTFEKIGEYEATVSAADMAHIVVRAGTLRLTKDCVVGGSLKTFGTGKVVVDGATLYLNDGFAIGAVVETVNGGRVVKQGTGTFTGYAGSDGSLGLPPEMHVRQGTVNYSLAGCPAKRWRLTFKKMKNDATSDKWYAVNRIWLFDADGQRVGGDMQYLAQGSEMKKGYVQFVANETLEHSGSDSWNDLPRLAWLFTHGQDSSNKNNYPFLRGLSRDISLDVPKSWVSIEWWLNDNAHPVTSYNLGYYESGRYPTDWDLSAYDEELRDWTVVDSRRGFTPSKDQSQNWMDGFSMGEYFAANKAPPSELFRLNSFMRSGMDFASAPTAVRVDDGAVLDLTSFTVGEGEIDTLAIAGSAGTIRGGALAAAGTIDLTDYNLFTNVPIPLELDGTAGVANLANWQVCVDGIPYAECTPAYDAEEKALRLNSGYAYLHVTETTTGDIQGQFPDKTVYVEIDETADFTNSVALAGSDAIVLIGLGRFVQTEPSPDYSGTITVRRGRLDGRCDNAYGTGTVEIQRLASGTCLVILGSQTEATTYDNDFVICPAAGYESTTETSIQIVTSKQKKVTVNGDITAYGNLYVADSKSGDSQNSDVVYFKGTVAADGYRLAYPCDNRVRWQGPVVAREFYVRSGYPGMGTHYLYSSSNRFEAITCLYNNISAVGTNVMGGAAWTFPSGSGRENARGALSPAGRDQTLASLNGIPSDGGFSIDYANDTASVLTLTGGVASATVRAALGVPGNKKYGGVSLVVDAGNDDFTQIFTNSVGTTRGTVTVRNGTLRFAGASSLTNVPSFAVTGGRLELESTKADAFVNVTNVTVGANATLKVGAAAVTPFADGGRVVLTLDKDAVLDLPAGAELVVQRAYRNGSPVMKGDYSGVADEGVTARDWIVGAGRLRILAGGTGMLLYVQ